MNTLYTVLQNMKQQIQAKTFSADAKKRLLRDLTAIHVRLEKDEYETSAITKNIFDIVDETKQFYMHLHTYERIARTWQEILRELPVAHFSQIVDLCPGYTPKVELALLYMEYEGTIVVLDKEKESIRGLQKFISLFNPQFTVKPLVEDLFTKSVGPYDFVIGNHIIDDLILAYFAEKAGISTQNLYENEEEFIKMWSKILKNKTPNHNEIVQKLAAIFVELIADNGYLCLAHYEGFMEKMLSLKQENIFTQRVFKSVSKNLVDNGFILYPIKPITYEHKYFDNHEVIILHKKN